MPTFFNLSETEVDIVGLCQEGHFLVVGERSGNLHLIHVPLRQTLLTRVCKIHFLLVPVPLKFF